MTINRIEFSFRNPEQLMQVCQMVYEVIYLSIELLSFYITQSLFYSYYHHKITLTSVQLLILHQHILLFEATDQ